MTLSRKISYTANNILTRVPFKGSRRIARTVAKLLLGSPKDGIQIVETTSGEKIQINPNKYKGIDESYYYFGIYEPGVINIMKRFLNSGDVLLAVGGNIGSMEITASKFVGKSGKVYSFEPDPELVKVIKKNITLNSIRNVSVQPYGLGKEKAKLTLNIAEDVNRGASSIAEVRDGKKVEVDVETLDHFVHSEKIKKVDMILVDVEGWEYEVLLGAKTFFKKFNPLISIECVKKYQPENIYKYFKKLGVYSFYKLDKGKENVSDLIKVHNVKEIPFEDNLFCLTEDHKARLGVS